jgi:hypothetical protein
VAYREALLDPVAAADAGTSSWIATSACNRADLGDVVGVGDSSLTAECDATLDWANVDGACQCQEAGSGDENGGEPHYALEQLLF